MSEAKSGGRRWFPRWRKMTWTILAWNALILVWIVSAAGGSGESVDECVADSGGILTRRDCQEAVDAGTGIGVFLILVLWALVFVVLALVWFMTRPRSDGAAELAREMRLAREAQEAERGVSRGGG